MSRAPINVGIIGLGMIGKTYAECLDDPYFDGRVKRIALAEPDPNKLREFAELSPQHKYVSDYRDLPNCDVIIIALPTSMHLQAVSFLCGKTDLLLIEKPLGASHHESAQIVAALTTAKQRAMCGLVGLFHPEFTSMYEQLTNVGQLLEVSEILHEAGAHLGQYLIKPYGVLTDNGIHTLHRFMRIAAESAPDRVLELEHCEMATREFLGSPGEDFAKGRLRVGDGPVFEFDVAFRSVRCDNGLPIHYMTEVRGSRGVIHVKGWEKCESVIDGQRTVHYEHPDGPLNGRSQYPRIRLGMRHQLDACLEFLDSEECSHFTLDEALRAQELIESCYRSACRGS